MTNDTSNDQQANSLSSWLGQLWRGVSVPLTAVLLAGIIGSIILWLSDANPWEAYTALYQGAFGSDSPSAARWKKQRRLF